MPDSAAPVTRHTADGSALPAQRPPRHDDTVRRPLRQPWSVTGSALVVFAVAIACTSGAEQQSRSEDDVRHNEYIREMCDRNEGGSYHIDSLCVQRYGGFR